MKDIKIFRKEKKRKKRQYGRERCKNLSGDEKQKLVGYRKKKVIKREAVIFYN